MAHYQVRAGDSWLDIYVKGRDEWALQQLMQMGELGCTPIHNPAPRWSGYIHNLRRAGVDIETLHESHGGPYPGHHARYILRCWVRPVEVRDVA